MELKLKLGQAFDLVVNLWLSMVTSHFGIPGFKFQLYSVQVLKLMHTLRNPADNSISSWDSATHMRDLNWVHGFQLSSGRTLDHVSVGSELVTESTRCVCVCVSVYVSLSLSNNFLRNTHVFWWKKLMYAFKRSSKRSKQCIVYKKTQHGGQHCDAVG